MGNMSSSTGASLIVSPVLAGVFKALGMRASQFPNGLNAEDVAGFSHLDLTRELKLWSKKGSAFIGHTYALGYVDGVHYVAPTETSGARLEFRDTEAATITAEFACEPQSYHPTAVDRDAYTMPVRFPGGSLGAVCVASLDEPALWTPEHFMAIHCFSEEAKGAKYSVPAVLKTKRGESYTLRVAGASEVVHVMRCLVLPDRVGFMGLSFTLE